MKALYCEACGTITSPGQEDRVPRSCGCGAHRCWWENGATGQFRVEYMDGHPLTRETGAPPTKSALQCWVLGISNSFLQHTTAGTPSKEDIDTMLARTPDSYLFKKTGSMIVRLRPGQTSDTAWARFES